MCRSDAVSNSRSVLRGRAFATLWRLLGGLQSLVLAFGVCDEFRNALKTWTKLILVQIGVAICSLAVLSAKDSELWGRCSDGAW